MPSKVITDMALFRFSVVSEVRVRVARGQVRAQAVRATAGQLHVAPDGRARQVGLRSVYRWLAAYEAEGLAGLHNAPRTSTDGALEPALVQFLIDQKAEDPRASVPQLLRLAVTVGLLDNATDADRTTAWRALKRRHVDTRRQRRTPDQRRFQKAHRLQLLLCDGKHFRAGPTRRKRVALFFIDDTTRYIPEVVVGTTETAELFLRGFHRLLYAVGRIDAIYLDNGSGFSAHDSRQVVAGLGIAHILGTEGYPEGKGKIERFNQTVQEDLLRHLTHDDVDPDCSALELRIGHYLRTDYNAHTHGALAKGETPRSRFLADPRKLEPYTDEAALRQRFFVDVERTVTNDHVVSINGRAWEVPRGLARQRITVRRDVFDPSHLLLDHKGRTLRLQEVDLVANANNRRAQRAPEPPPPTTSKGAALTATDADLAPITEPDRGFAVVNQETDGWNSTLTSGVARPRSPERSR